MGRKSPADPMYTVQSVKCVDLSQLFALVDQLGWWELEREKGQVLILEYLCIRGIRNKDDMPNTRCEYYPVKIFFHWNSRVHN